jgi:hypothetical protein
MIEEDLEQQLIHGKKNNILGKLSEEYLSRYIYKEYFTSNKYNLLNNVKYKYNKETIGRKMNEFHTGNKYEIATVAPDGNCFYSAVIKACVDIEYEDISKFKNSVQNFRNELVKNMTAQKDKYLEHYGDEKIFRKLIESIAGPKKGKNKKNDTAESNDDKNDQGSENNTENTNIPKQYWGGADVASIIATLYEVRFHISLGDGENDFVIEIKEEGSDPSYDIKLCWNKDKNHYDWWKEK